VAIEWLSYRPILKSDKNSLYDLKIRVIMSQLVFASYWIYATIEENLAVSVYPANNSLRN
jgi:hypothetical protein